MFRLNLLLLTLEEVDQSILGVVTSLELGYARFFVVQPKVELVS